MHAITIPEPGGPDALVWAEVPDPEPGPDEVLIEVTASAVNRADLLQRQGHYPPPPGAPPYPGLECSGHGRRLGRAGLRAAGRRRLRRAGGGAGRPAAADPARADASRTPPRCRRSPARSGPTWSQLARLTKGETLLVHGGGSGIGTFAIQLGAALGATVITTARRGQARARCASSAPTSRSTTPTRTSSTLVQRARRRRRDPGHHGRAPTSTGTSQALAPGGRIAVIGLQGGRDGGAEPGRADDQAGVDLRDHAAGPSGRAKRRRSYGGSASRCGRWSSPGRSGRSSTAGCRCRRRREAHRVVESSDHLGKILLLNAAPLPVDQG